MGAAHEGMHIIKTEKIDNDFIDLAKAHDKVNWLYIRSVLLQIGMNLQTINWIMGCLSLASFFVLINGSRLLVLLMPQEDSNNVAHCPPSCFYWWLRI